MRYMLTSRVHMPSFGEKTMRTTSDQDLTKSRNRTFIDNTRSSEPVPGLLPASVTSSQSFEENVISNKPHDSDAETQVNNVINTNSSVLAPESLPASATPPQFIINTDLFKKNVISSTLQDPDAATQMNNVIQAFNQYTYNAATGIGIPPSKIITTSPVRGQRIPPGFYRIFSLNNLPYLVGPTDENIAKVLYPLSTSSVHVSDLISQTDSHTISHGRHIVNVPPGKIAKALMGNQPIFLEVGPHVIRHAQFQLIEYVALYPLRSIFRV